MARRNFLDPFLTFFSHMFSLQTSAMNDDAVSRDTHYPSTKRRDIWVFLNPDSYIYPNVTGVVYVTREGKAIFWPIKSEGEGQDIAEARYLQKPLPEILSLTFKGQLACDQLGPLGELPQLKDQQAMIYYLYGEQWSPIF